MALRRSRLAHVIVIVIIYRRITGAHASDGDASHHVQPCDILSAAAAAAATAHSEMANLTMNQLSGGQRLTKVSGVDNANEAMVTSALRVRCNAR